MPDKLVIVQTYYDLVEAFHTDRTAYEAVLHPDVEQTTYPNAFMPQAHTRRFDALVAAVAVGRGLLRKHHFKIDHTYEKGDTLILEGRWQGEMAMNEGHLREGQLLKAHLCVIFEFKDGRIYRQRNYDCYEPF